MLTAQRGAAAATCPEQARNGGGRPQERTRCSQWRPGLRCRVRATCSRGGRSSAAQRRRPGLNHPSTSRPRARLWSNAICSGDPAVIRIRTAQLEATSLMAST